MASSSFESSKAVPTEITPFDLSFAGPVPQGKKKKSSRSVFSQVVVLFFLVGLCFTVYSRLSSLASSTSLVNQSISKSVNKDQNENDNIVFPTASLVESKTKTRLQQVTKAATTTTTELSEEGAAKFTLEFPPGIYDKSMNDNPREILAITNKCNTYVNDNKEKSADPLFMANILACQIYQSRTVPIVLGTLKTGKDVLEIATDMDTIDSSKVSPLFVEYAFAAMIDYGCFVWNNQDSEVSYSRTQYSGKTTYSTETSSKTGLDVDSSASFFGVTVEAGYEQSNTNSGGSEGTTETAYGQEKYSDLVGKLTNVCFSSQPRFTEIVKDLVKPKWIDCWTAIREKGRYQTVEDLLNLEDRDCFSDVADGGFLMPLQYVYKVGTKSTLSTSYTTSSATQATGASQAITAGLKAIHGDVSGSVDTAITNAVDNSKATSKFTSNVNQKTVAFGYDVPITCFEDNTCPQVITTSVKSIRDDYMLLGSPSSLGREYKSLDEIMKLYFGDYGLPDLFLAAYNKQLHNYNQYRGYIGLGSKDGDLKCFNFGSQQAIEEYCNNDPRCGGYSYSTSSYSMEHGGPWLCAKKTSEKGLSESTGVWYEKPPYPTDYIKYKNYGGIGMDRGVNDINCGLFDSQQAIEAWCNTIPACRGYSYYTADYGTRRGGPWWCTKTTSGKGDYNPEAVWYQKRL